MPTLRQPSIVRNMAKDRSSLLSTRNLVVAFAIVEFVAIAALLLRG